MVAAAIGMGAWTLLMATVFLLLLLFPSGKAPSRRWGMVARLILLSFALVWVGVATSPTVDPPFEDFENPLAFSSGDSYRGAAWALIGLCLIAVAAAAINLLVRFWRSGGDEREQYKWLAFAGCFLVATLPLALVTSFESGIAGTMVFLALIALPVAVGIAVLKYRLYEIDVLINRTLVYVPLTAILAGLFVASTTLVRTIFTDLTRTGSDVSVAASTVAIVALLTPLKNNLQFLVDRYFKEQPDPYAGVNKLTGQAKAVIQILDRGRFAASVLNQLVTGLAAAAARVELDNENWSMTVGTPNESQPVEVALVFREACIGTLVVWPGADAAAIRPTPEGLTGTADVLAEVVSLGTFPGKLGPRPFEPEPTLLGDSLS
jgi:hypothetical protein